MGRAIKRAALGVTAAGVLTLIAFVLLLIQAGGPLKPADHPNSRGFNTAMTWFELVDSPEEVFLALGDPGTETGRELREKIDAMNRVDFLFMVAYSCFNAALFVFLYLIIKEEDQVSEKILLWGGLALCVLMLAGDFLENLNLLELSSYLSQAQIPTDTVSMLGLWTRIKWFSLFLSGCMLAWMYFRYFGARLSGIIFSLLFFVYSVAGSSAFVFSGKGYLLEAAVNLMGLAWTCALGHAAVNLYRRRGEA